MRNFLSVGQVVQAINLNTDELSLVLGENLDLGGDGNRNGVGKTTMIQAVSYALFGAPINNIRKDNLINRTNGKGMMVTLEFIANSIDYKIERGRKPNILKFYVNNDLQEMQDDAQGENKETQIHIEKAIGMSHDMFKHIVALNTYSEPFLALKAGEQRNVIEQLLGITLLSEKADVIRNLIKETKDNIQLEEFKNKAIEEANKRIIEQIDSLKRRQKLWDTKYQEEIQSLDNEISELSQVDIEKELEGHTELAAYNQRKKDHADLDKNIIRTSADLEKEKKALAKLEKELITLREHKCYACGQEFHDEKHTSVVTTKEATLQETNNTIKELTQLLLDLNQAKEEIGPIGKQPKLFYDTEKEAYEHRSKLDSLVQRKISKENETNPYIEQIADMENQALQVISFDKINEYTRLGEHQKFLLDLLTSKDSFVRKKIIDQNLSYLNARLTHYLDKIGLPHQVVFQNDLSVEITELGRELDFYNLSRGEMNRLILSLSWAFRDVWESLYCPINVMFIDELLDSGMDFVGIENSISVLKELNRRRNKSIWLVSHRDDLATRVNSVLRVVKEHGFTSYNTATDTNFM